MRERAPGSRVRQGPQSVTQLTLRLKSTLEARFSAVEVEGEVSSARRVSSGHLYLTLKDKGAQLPAVIWRSTLARMRSPIRDGMQIIAHGDIQVYAPHGRYQMVVSRVTEAGMGTRLIALEALKQKLTDEGLFDADRKRDLPFLPRRIAIITAHTGAAVQDILRTTLSRYPAELVIYPAPVQGPHAAPAIAKGIEIMGTWPGIDAIIVGRGGGSVDDLWAFNEEIVVRAIAACPTPVISAVGHEVDTLLTDHVADRRAATPTAAGEMVVPSHADLTAHITHQRDRLVRGLVARIERGRLQLDAGLRRLPRPRRMIAERQQALDERRDRLGRAMARRITTARTQRDLLAARVASQHPRVALRTARARLAGLEARLMKAATRPVGDGRRRLASLERALGLLAPTAPLRRGFALVRTEDGRVVRSPEDLRSDQHLNVEVAGGAFDVRVQSLGESTAAPTAGRIL